jgi:flagellar biosynthesis protein FlhA
MMSFVQKMLKQTDIMVGLGVLLIVGMLILPLPEFVLDTGLTLAIAMSVIILLASINISDPLEFSVFPSLLLITTLFRLSLSIAATKLILGTGSAGHVIETFGKFVMGGDPVVGFVAFLIIVIVQFMVITNGSGRVAEVVARFTLDAMPGKQLAIDADLAAGLIDEDGARARRKHIKREADFYGAMDGASKFVKGDATASMLMIAVNLIGGFVIGWMHGSGDPMQILSTYSLLSVGEGMVSQIPALMISTASGLMVTRAGQDRSMGNEVAGQLMGQPKAIGFAGVALAGLAFVPGFPTFIFLGAAAGCLIVARFLAKSPNASKLLSSAKPEAATPAATRPADQRAAAPQGPEAVIPLLAVDAVEIEIGYGLTPLADPRLGGDLSERITATRRQIALELGFVMPTVRIRDSVHLESDQYVIKIRGEMVAQGKAMPSNFLAVNSGAISHAVSGVPTKDPVFGLDALWVTAANKDVAEKAGYTVIEPSAVISTHLAEIIKTYGAELLSRQDVQVLLDNAKVHNSAVVDELVPQVLQLGDIQKVLQHLLRERVPIRDMVTILETMADYGGRLKDPDQLGEVVRSAISRTITRQYLDTEHKLFCITLEPAYERQLAEAVQLTSLGTQLQLDPNTQRQLIEKLRREMDAASSRGLQPVLICGTTLRLPVRRLLEKTLPSLSVMAYNEVAPKADVEFVGQVKAA